MTDVNEKSCHACEIQFKKKLAVNRLTLNDKEGSKKILKERERVYPCDVLKF